jgi:hypothetical protein
MVMLCGSEMQCQLLDNLKISSPSFTENQDDLVGENFGTWNCLTEEMI